jgi:hypothetical protein
MRSARRVISAAARSRKGHQQDPVRIGVADDQMRDAMRERISSAFRRPQRGFR